MNEEKPFFGKAKCIPLKGTMLLPYQEKWVRGLQGAAQDHGEGAADWVDLGDGLRAGEAQGAEGGAAGCVDLFAG
jgi:hypothetical protein